MNANILELLEHSAATVPDRPSYISENAQLTWAELEDQARRIGSFLAQRLEPGSAVSIIMDRDVWCVAAILGVIYAGCFSAPLDPAQPADRVSRVYDTLRPKYLLYDHTAAAILESLGDNLPCPAAPYAEAAAAEIDQARLDDIRYWSSATDPIEIFYTSGSTGQPKGVVHTHRSMLFYAHRVVSWTELVNAQEVWGNQAPFFYSNAIFDLFPPMMLGSTVVLIPSQCFLFPKLFIQFFREHKITTLLMTPLNYQYIADSGALTPHCMPDLRSVYLCGEAVTGRLMAAWSQAAAPDVRIFNFYGSTECPYMTLFEKDTIPVAQDEIAPSGYLLQGVHLYVLDEDQQPLPQGEIGEMYVTAPWISCGYYRDPDRTKAAFVTDPLDFGWDQFYYRTGDLGWFDEHGLLHVAGRRDTQIKHRGYRMDLGEVEAALRSLEGWQNGCALYNDKEDKIYCFWTGPISQTDMKRLLPEKLEKYMLPNVYVWLETLPRTSSGKLDRMTLKARYFGK